MLIFDFTIRRLSAVGMAANVDLADLLAPTMGLGCMLKYGPLSTRDLMILCN